MLALADMVKGAAQLNAVGPRAAGRFPKDFLGSGGAKLFYLSIKALALGRDSCVTVFHG
jgi:hypothetical protein